MPHAWKAGEQTMLLRKQIEAMADGGTFVLAVPAAPLRCPPAPYERASLIAHYLKNNKPRSKVLILDAKDGFSQQKLFEAAWKELYPGMIERIALSQGGRVTSVDAATNTIVTDFGNYTADVASVIPPQKAGRIAEIAGAADNTGWCPIDPVSFASKLVPNIHVIGDACIAGQLPKSASAASGARQGLRRRDREHAVRQAAGDAAADRRLLQHGRARLRVLAVGRLSAQGRAVRRGRERDQPGQCAARGAPARSGACGKLVQDDHGGHLWLGQSRSWRHVLEQRGWRCLPADAQTLRPYAVVGDAIPERLTATPGDVARGRALVVERTSTCILCHSGPFPELRFQGDLAPSLAGSGSRWSEGQLRLRLVDASHLNAATIMPSYYRVDGLDRVGPSWRGKPILSAEQIEDIVAYLASLRE